MDFIMTGGSVKEVMLTSLVVPISRTLLTHGIHIIVCKQIQQSDRSTGLPTVSTINSREKVEHPAVIVKNPPTYSKTYVTQSETYRSYCMI